MKRLFWVAMGASAGIVVVVMLRKKASSLAPAAMAGGLAEAIRDFGAEVRAGMAEREGELRRQLGLDADDLEPSLDEHPFESRFGQDR